MTREIGKIFNRSDRNFKEKYKKWFESVSQLTDATTLMFLFYRYCCGSDIGGGVLNINMSEFKEELLEKLGKIGYYYLRPEVKRQFPLFSHNGKSYYCSFGSQKDQNFVEYFGGKIIEYREI